MADYKTLKTNELLFQQGDLPDNMYIVRTGKISIFVTDGDKEKELAQVVPGELIGELAIFDKKSRSAGARALCDSSVVILPYSALESQLHTLPEWVKITMKTLAEKLRLTNQKLFELENQRTKK